MTAPDAFAAAVARAAARGDRGALALYDEEARTMPWAQTAAQLVAAALATLPAPHPPDRVLLFTGHMVDAPDRAQPRFPRTAEAEAMARSMIAEAVRAQMAAGGHTLGIAGGASGGDILFHEACRGVGVETKLLLALPPAQFERASVARAGAHWVERFRALCAATPPTVLQETEAPPAWLGDAAGFDLWQRNNRWLLASADATHAAQRTLIALYNPDLDADGPGGTAHLIDEARRRGFATRTLDARALLHARGQPSP